MDVGIRDLKEHLSEYLDRVAAGEIIRVTERGQPKALLTPLPGVNRLTVGIADGWIRAGKDTPPVPVTRMKSRRRVADVVAEDRDK